MNTNHNKCSKCDLTIHSNFIGYHKCGYANCPICKIAITNSEYWYHIRSHPGHENDSPTSLQRKETFGNRSYGGHGSGTSFNRDSTFFEGVEVGKEYVVDITEMGRQGDGIARVQGFIVFVKNGKVGQKVKVKVVQVGNRYATAVMAS